MLPQKTRTMHAFLRLLFIFSLCVGRCSGHYESTAAIRQDGECEDSIGFGCGKELVTKRRHLRRDTGAAEDENRRGGWLSRNFVMTDNLPDGEREIRIHYNGVTAKETSVGNNGSGLVLRQFTDGRHFVQTILTKDGNILDCEYVDQKSAVKSFVRNFRKEIRGSPHINPKRRKHKKNNSERDITSTKDRASETRNFHDEELDSDAFFDQASFYDDSSITVDINRKSLEDNRRQKWRRPRDFRARRATHRISHGLWNVTIEDLEDGQLPQELATWLNFEKTMMQCDEIHERLRREYGMTDDDSSSPNVHRGKRSLLIFPGTLWCGAGQSAMSFKELGPLSSADTCCRTHDHCPVRISALEHRYSLLNRRPHTVSHCACDKRCSRSNSNLDNDFCLLWADDSMFLSLNGSMAADKIRSKRVSRNALLIPGTKWCGKGNDAMGPNHLGEFSSTDRCCRKHDHACPFWIDGVSEKYGLFNWRPNSLMHCRCDERFRTCLKLANTDVANMVGRLFFNIVQTKCFVLKPVKVCVERSWWGKCLKKGYAKQAHLRDNLPY